MRSRRAKKSFLALLLRICLFAGVINSVSVAIPAMSQGMVPNNPVLAALASSIDSLVRQHSLADFRLTGEAKWSEVIHRLTEGRDHRSADGFAGLSTIFLDAATLELDGSRAQLELRTITTLSNGEAVRDVTTQTFLLESKQDLAELGNAISVRETESFWNSTAVPILTAIGGAAIVALFFLIRS